MPGAGGGLGPRPGVQGRQGASALTGGLEGAEVLINLGPLTPDTRGILGAPLFAQLPLGACIVNFARGGHLVEADLLEALDGGRLRHAVLDVFATEPLPPDHPFWTHPRVTMLPHVAALTDAHSAASVVAANLERIERGQAPLHPVDRPRGSLGLRSHDPGGLCVPRVHGGRPRAAKPTAGPPTVSCRHARGGGRASAGRP